MYNLHLEGRVEAGLKENLLAIRLNLTNVYEFYDEFDSCL